MPPLHWRAVTIGLLLALLTGAAQATDPQLPDTANPDTVQADTVQADTVTVDRQQIEPTAAPVTATATPQPATDTTSASVPAETPAAAAPVALAVPLPDAATALIVEDADGSRPAPAVDTAAASPPSPAPSPVSADPVSDAAATTVVDISVPLPDPPDVTVVNGLATAVTVPLPEAAAAIIVEADTVAAAMRSRLDPARLLGRGLARLSRRDRDALVTFYEARNWAPLWMTGTAAAPKAHAVADLLARADEDGLDPAAYPVPSLTTQLTASSRADAEIALSAAAVVYAHDARGGRLDPTRLSGLITPVLELPDPAAVLAGLSEASDPAAVLAGFQPPHAGYRALKAYLRQMRDATASLPATPPVFEGPPLREGDLDQRVPLLRSRLDLAARPDTVYDAELRQAVATLQKRNRIRATGVFDARTADLLEPHPQARSLRGLGTADVIANMERWRWLPQDLGERHIMVNLPDFSLRLVEGGRTIHRARVIVGKAETQTPVFSHRMEHVVVNPSWHIPPSIMKNEILPGLARDPGYAARRGYEVVRRGNTISVRQPPGERNALGFIKFMFPNQHSVYLHDTPSRGLFSADRRAFSHGCVRVDQPFRLAEFVLGDQGYTEERLRRLIGSGERTIKLTRFLPVHLGYFTVFVDEDGQLQRREDLYGHDGRVKTALGLSADGRRYAEIRR